MACNNLLENFLMISGMAWWLIALIVAIIIYKQREMIKHGITKGKVGK